MKTAIVFLETYMAAGSDTVAKSILENLSYEVIHLFINQNCDKRILKLDTMPKHIKIHYYGIVTPSTLSVYAIRISNKLLKNSIRFLNLVIRYPLIIFSIAYFYIKFKKIDYSVFISINGGYPAAEYCRSACLASSLLFAISFLIRLCDFSTLFLPDIPSEYLYFGVWFGFLTWLTQIYIKISDAFALSVSVELIKVFHKIVSMLLLVGLIYGMAFDLPIYFYFNYIALVSFLVIISMLFIKKEIFTKSLLTLRCDYQKIMREFIHFCSPLVVFNIIGIGAGVFDIWLLQMLGGSVQSGFYGLAYSIAAMCFLFTSAMTPIITREFAKYYEQYDLENIKKLFHRYIPMLYSVSAYFAVFIAFQSEKLIEIFTDEKFKGASIVLMVMAFYPIHQTYGQLSGSLFFATNKTHLYKNIGIISSLIGVILTLIFLYILKLEALGLAWKMVLVQIISVTIQLYFNCKFLDIPMKYFIIHQLYSILFFVVCAFLSQNHFLKVDSLVLEFLISGCVYTLFVAIGGLIFPQIFALTLREIKQGLKR